MPLHLPPERKLSISGPAFNPTVELDGHNLSSAIRSLTISFSVNHMPKVEADLAIHAVEVIELGVPESQFIVSMSKDARAGLIAAGWTPPADAR